MDFKINDNKEDFRRRFIAGVSSADPEWQDAAVFLWILLNCPQISNVLISAIFDNETEMDQVQGNVTQKPGRR